LKFAFQVYDIKGDGFISNGELFEVNITFHKSKLKGIKNDGW